MVVKVIVAVILICITISVSDAGVTDCPEIPDGLTNVSDLNWDVVNKSINMRIDANSQSKYLQVGLIWDLFSEKLEAVTETRTVEALSLVDELDMGDVFFTENDASRLNLSPIPTSNYALYMAETSSNTVFSVNMDTLETVELGGVTDNLSDLDVMWYSADKAIIVVKPIYGSGFYSYDVCLDGSCFTDLNQFLGYQPQRPALNSQNSLLAIYDVGSSLISVIDLQSKNLQREYPVEPFLLQSVNPIWSEDGSIIYFLGFDEMLARLVIYQLDLTTGTTDALADFDLTDSVIQHGSSYPIAKYLSCQETASVFNVMTKVSLK